MFFKVFHQWYMNVTFVINKIFWPHSRLCLQISITISIALFRMSLRNGLSRSFVCFTHGTLANWIKSAASSSGPACLGGKDIWKAMFVDKIRSWTRQWKVFALYIKISHRSKVCCAFEKEERFNQMPPLKNVFFRVENALDGLTACLMEEELPENVQKTVRSLVRWCISYHCSNPFSSACALHFFARKFLIR